MENNKYIAVVPKNFEYNDEYYYTRGSLFPTKLYKNKKKAIQKTKEKLESNIEFYDETLYYIFESEEIEFDENKFKFYNQSLPKDKQYSGDLNLFCIGKWTKILSKKEYLGLLENIFDVEYIEFLYDFPEVEIGENL